MDGTELGSAVLHVKNIFRIGKERQQQTVSQSVGVQQFPPSSCLMLVCVRRRITQMLPAECAPNRLAAAGEIQG